MPEVVVDGLAAYRLARVLVADTIAEPLRQWLFLRWPPPGWLLDPGEAPVYPKHSKVVWSRGHWNKAERKLERTTPDDERPVQFFTEKGTKLGEGLRCWWCTTVWFAVAVSVVRRPRLLLHPFRLAARAAAVAAVAAGAVEMLERRTHLH